MEKLDLTKLYKPYYSAKTTPALANIEPAEPVEVGENHRR